MAIVVQIKVLLFIAISNMAVLSRWKLLSLLMKLVISVSLMHLTRGAQHSHGARGSRVCSPRDFPQYF